MENKNQSEVAKTTGSFYYKSETVIIRPGAVEDGLVEVKLNISNIDLYAMEL